jgi:drug/metabolite transporter (DMT)-like permease
MGARDLGLLVILSVLWGGSFFFVELALPGLPPLTIVFARVAGAALCLALWLWARGIERPRGVAAWRALAVRGF